MANIYCPKCKCQIKPGELKDVAIRRSCPHCGGYLEIKIVHRCTEELDKQEENKKEG